MVRVANIHRRLAEAGQTTVVDKPAVADLGAQELPDDLWDLVLACSMVDEVVEKAAESLELSLIARHALELAQRLNGLYSRHPILREEDPLRRLGRLAAFECFRRALANLAGILGIPVPERM